MIPQHLKGEASPFWKGDSAQVESKRVRAVKLYPLGPCEACGAKATDIHHKNGDTGNNERANIMILCRKCHMKIDGRLEKFVASTPHLVLPIRNCENCGTPYKPLRKGLCHKCNEYQRRNGKPRSASVIHKCSVRTVGLLEQIKTQMSQGDSFRKIAITTGVSYGAVQLAIKQIRKDCHKQVHETGEF